MARPLRIEYPGAYYHVMNRGLAQNDVFLDQQDRERFLGLVGEVCRLWGVVVYAYCLMDTHYHLLLQTPWGGLSRAMRHLDGIYTQSYNRAHHRDGPLFRGRYRAILIDAEEYFLAVMRYIHHNPVEAGLASDIDRYRWSSHWGYINHKRAPKWLDRAGVLSRFGRGVRGFREYQEFMHSKVEGEVEDFYQHREKGSILGGREFVQRVMRKIGERAKMKEEKPESRRVFRYEIEEIMEATARVYGKAVRELRKTRRGQENEARAMAMYLCRRLGGYKLTEIGKVVGLEKYSSVSSACLAIKGRLEKEKGVVQRARQVEEILLKSQQQT